MRPEDRLRARCRMYLDAALPPPGWFSAIEHGRKHHGTEQQRMAEWSRLRAQGVKVGISDILVMYLGELIGVELKVGKNEPSKNQTDFGEMMEANGFKWRVIRSVCELHDWLVYLGIPIARSMFLAAVAHDAALAQPEALKPRRTSKPKAAKPKASTIAKMNRARGSTMF